MGAKRDTEGSKRQIDCFGGHQNGARRRVCPVFFYMAASRLGCLRMRVGWASGRSTIRSSILIML